MKLFLGLIIRCFSNEPSPPFPTALWPRSLPYNPTNVASYCVEFPQFFLSKDVMKWTVWNWACLAMVLPLFGAHAKNRFEHPPIEYSKSTPNNAVSHLQTRLDKGDVKWSRDKYTGYLRSLLQALDVGVESQTLVFSKTSLQGRLISPKRPRALYFNDEIYVGYVAGSQVMEVSVADPTLGAVFFTFDQDALRLKRRVGDCMSCHGSSRTNYQPGHLLRSVYSADDGQPIFRAGSNLTNHESPHEQRWGGWFVSGQGGSLPHMGNAMAEVTADDKVVLKRPSDAGKASDLGKYFDTDRYLSSHSDIVAMMVQDHQVHMHNLLAAGNYDTRYALHDQRVIDKALERDSTSLRASTLRRIASTGEKIIQYMLFTKEAPLPNKVSGSTKFAEKFSRRGPRDTQGRSLYQLDLKKRLLKYPCSYLIYTDAFDQLPSQMKKYLYRRLWEILSGQDQTQPYARLSPSTRRTILEILLQTKSDLPDYWKLEP